LTLQVKKSWARALAQSNSNNEPGFDDGSAMQRVHAKERLAILAIKHYFAFISGCDMSQQKH
jgi:hypothetical protein